MNYQLITVTGAGAPRLLGAYASYDSALIARANDVIEQLMANGGWWTRAEHIIVGPGLQGPDTEHGHCTELGVDPGRTEPPGPADVIDARDWLYALHQPCTG